MRTIYNRYIPSDESFERIEEEEDAPHLHPPQAKRTPADKSRPLSPLQKGAGLLDGLTGRLGGLLKGFHLEELDSGDILLVLILLFLFLESDDNLELVITLGLLLLFGLFGKDDEKQEAENETEEG